MRFLVAYEQPSHVVERWESRWDWSTVVGGLIFAALGFTDPTLSSNSVTQAVFFVGGITTLMIGGNRVTAKSARRSAKEIVRLRDAQDDARPPDGDSPPSEQ